MTPVENNDQSFPEAQPDAAAIQRRVDEIDGSLLSELPDDQRLQSGAPEIQRASEEDFIQMTGLTGAGGPPVLSPESGNAVREDLDPARPVCFFEKGVADVDAAMTPPALEAGRPAEQAFFAGNGDASTVANLEDMIADLGQDHPEEVPGGRTPAAAPSPPVVGEGFGSRLALGEDESEVTEAIEQTPQADRTAAGLVARPLRGRSDPTDLIEAEQLLQALQNQPRADAAIEQPYLPTPLPPAVGVATPISSVPGLSPDEELYEEDDDSVSGQPWPAHRHRSRRRYSTVRRHVMPWGIRIVVLLLVAGGITAVYRWFKPHVVKPEAAFRVADALVAGGEFEAASEEYLRLARLHPTGPECAQAEFDAAFALLLAEHDSFDETRQTYERALALFQRFIDHYPSHVKTVRAESLMGWLNFRLERYEQAIDLLRRPDLRLRDSSAALPALRTLARAYTQMGDYPTAESMYLQAASMSDNYSADVDYNELGDLFRTRADNAPAEPERVTHQRAAIRYWAYAMREPGIDPVSKARIKEKYDWLLAKVPEGEFDAASGAVEMSADVPNRDRTAEPNDEMNTEGRDGAAPMATGLPSSRSSELSPTAEAELLDGAAS